MTEETISSLETDPGCAVPNQPPVIRLKAKRDIFRFNGVKTSSINLDHVTQIELDEKKITFIFINNSIFVEFETIEAAQGVYEQILKIWAHDVVE